MSPPLPSPLHHSPPPQFHRGRNSPMAMAAEASLPRAETGVAQLLTSNPKADGRGVKVVAKQLHSHVHAHTRTHTHTHTPARTRTHAHAHARTRTRTHTHQPIAEIASVREAVDQARRVR